MPRVKYTSALTDSLLLVRACTGVSLFNSRSVAQFNPDLRFIDIEPFGQPNFVAAWHESNKNTLVPAFVKLLMKGARLAQGLSPAETQEKQG